MTYEKEKAAVPSNTHLWRENIMKYLMKDAGTARVHFYD